MSRATDSSGQLSDIPELSVATIMESIPDAVVVAEFATGEIVAANEAAGELFECQTDDLIGRDHLELHPSGEADRYEEAFRRGFDGEQVERLRDGTPLYVQTASGGRTPVEINAQRIQAEERSLVLGVFRDISTRIDREQRLEQTTTRLNTLLDATPLPVAVLDSSGRVELWNRAAEDVFGYSSADIVGQYYPLFVDDGQLDDLLGEILAGGILDGHETILRAKDGSRVTVEIYARPLYDDGEVTGVIGSAVDVTGQKRRNQHLDVVHRLLRHNLRNNLTVIEGYASLLSAETETDSATRQEAAQKIAAASDELAKLSNHAKQVRRAVKVTEPRSTSVADLLSTVDTEGAATTDATVEAPAVHESAAVSSQSKEVLSWLFSRFVEYTDEPAIRLKVTVQPKYVQLDIHGDEQLVPPGDAELIRHGEETALKHGSNLDVARAYLTLTSIGGDIVQLEGSQPERSFRVEIPRTDL